MLLLCLKLHCISLKLTGRIVLLRGYLIATRPILHRSTSHDSGIIFRNESDVLVALDVDVHDPEHLGHGSKQGGS